MRSRSADRHARARSRTPRRTPRCPRRRCGRRPRGPRGVGDRRERLHRVDHQVQHDLDQAPFVADDGRRLAGGRGPGARAPRPPWPPASTRTAPRPRKSTGPRLLSSGRLKVRRSRVMLAMRAVPERIGRKPLAEALQRRPARRHRGALQLGRAAPRGRRPRVHPFGLREHVSERVVDLVSDAGRQRPERHHPIVLDRRPLQPVKLADVVGSPVRPTISPAGPRSGVSQVW